MAAILVAPGQVEEQVADGAQVEPATRSAEGGLGRQAAIPEGRRQELDRIGRRRGPLGGSGPRPGGWTARRLPAVVRATVHYYNAEQEVARYAAAVAALE